MRRLRARMRRPARGQSLVEFALVLPIFLILILGILDFGRAVAAYNSVSNGARSGARVAIVNQDPVAIEDSVMSETLTLDEVEVDVDTNADPTQTNCPRIGCIVEVTVSATYFPATPIFSNLE